MNLSVRFICKAFPRRKTNYNLYKCMSISAYIYIYQTTWWQTIRENLRISCIDSRIAAAELSMKGLLYIK